MARGRRPRSASCRLPRHLRRVRADAHRALESPMAAVERLTDTEALMWSIERDPLLRATFLTVTILDRPPDLARFRRRMAHVAARIPRLHQRIDGRQWDDDQVFEIDYTIRTNA